ncbi:MAG: hypothetical protein HQK55_02110 [Deltaproteobacteria bacterium]|nr:hypothetical protein [Deltaproteobacteria bacterium]
MTPDIYNPHELARPNEIGRSIIQELNRLLENIYADLDVPRNKIEAVLIQGRKMATTPQAWPGGADEVNEFQTTLAAMERKIFQALDLRRLKDEGLIKVVKF